MIIRIAPELRNPQPPDSCDPGVLFPIAFGYDTFTGEVLARSMSSSDIAVAVRHWLGCMLLLQAESQLPPVSHHDDCGRFSTNNQAREPSGSDLGGLTLRSGDEALRGPMKQIVNSVGVSGPQKKRRSVAQILRESYALFTKDEETVMAVKMVLGSAGRYST
jgi:hypothetical protein